MTDDSQRAHEASLRRPVKGRGAVRNVRGRFASTDVVPFDDGWGSCERPPESPVTTLLEERTRKIITRNRSVDVPFDRSINPYKGCEHGCIYCFARPTHAYLDLSPGLDFESRIVIKPEAPRLLRAELAHPKYACKPITLGANTDAYQPIEGRLRITRAILEVLREHRHPVTIVTKSNLVLRDLDLLAPMARRRLATVLVSVTTLDRGLARRMEPRAPTPERRLHAVAKLNGAGVPAGVLASPMIPGLNDHELERIMQGAADAGARNVSYLALRLPHELKDLFEEWLRTHFPDRADKVLGRIRQMRGGRLNDPRFGKRMRGEGPHADLLARRFEVTRRRLGLGVERVDLDTTAFRVPGRPGPQARLF
jgi:DNA repair photolyase